MKPLIQTVQVIGITLLHLRVGVMTGVSNNSVAVEESTAVFYSHNTNNWQKLRVGAMTGVSNNSVAVEESTAVFYSHNTNNW